MRKSTIFMIAGVLLAAGGAAAIAGVGERGRFGHGHGMGGMFAHMGGGHGFGFYDRGAGRLKALDTDNDGSVTLEEALARQAPVFTRIDANGDGVIDAQEIEADTNLNVAYWTKAITHRFDANGDGQISKDELSQRRQRRDQADRKDDDGREWRERRHGWWHGRRYERRMTRLFDRFDLNSNGVLEASEIETAVKQRVTRRGNRMLARLDQDGDGRITREEFEKPARDRFAMRDIDKDGRITEEDLPPMMRGRGILR